jgi:predicted PurR-regulated permease PerM
MKQNIQLIDIPIRTFIKFFLVVGLIWTAWIVKDLVVAILVALIIATPTSNLADKLRKYYIPRGMTAFATLLALVAILVGIIVLFVPMLSGEISRFAETLPQFQVEIRNMVNTFTRTNDIQNLIGKVTSTDVANASQSAVSFLTSTLGATASAATSFIVQLLIIFVMAFYLAVQERGVERFLRLVSPIEKENYIVDLWERSQKKIQSWVNGQVLLAGIIGLTTFIGLSVLGMKYALLFALLATVCELIPVVGMTIATVPALIVAYLVGGVPMVLKVGVFYFILTQTENHILSPMVVNKVVGIPPIIVIISLLAGGMIAGFWGVLLAVPVAAIVMEFVNDVEEGKRFESSLVDEIVLIFGHRLVDELHQAQKLSTFCQGLPFAYIYSKASFIELLELSDVSVQKQHGYSE